MLSTAVEAYCYYGRECPRKQVTVLVRYTGEASFRCTELTSTTLQGRAPRHEAKASHYICGFQMRVVPPGCREHCSAGKGGDEPRHYISRGGSGPCSTTLQDRAAAPIHLVILSPDHLLLSF